MASTPWPLNSGGATDASRTRRDVGHGPAVDLGVAEIDAGPAADIRVVVEQRSDLRLGQILGAAEPGEQLVVPVPSVQRGMRHECLQARTECERRRDHDYGENGADDRRTYGHCAGASTGFEREADPRHGRCRQARIGGRTRTAHDPRAGARSCRRPSRCGALR